MKAKNIYFSIFVFTGILLSTSSTEKVSDNEYLLDIAKNYKNYTLYSNYAEKITDSVAYKKYINWSVSLCVQGIQKYPFGNDGHTFVKDSIYLSKTNISESKHGSKIYKLYVKDIAAYSYRTIEQPIGQVIVKETWDIKQIDSSDTTTSIKLKSLNDGKWYTTKSVSQLFIMHKEQKTDKNDQGWVYSIIDIETRRTKILEKGNLTNCIGCHKNNKYDRILGPK